VKKKLAVAAILVAVVLAVTVWLAADVEQPVLREGMTKAEVEAVIETHVGRVRPENFPEGRPYRVEGHYEDDLYVTEPNRFSSGARFRVRYNDANPENEWRVDSWEKESLPNRYLPWLRGTP
jgi:hypothetical protein